MAEKILVRGTDGSFFEPLPDEIKFFKTENGNAESKKLIEFSFGIDQFFGIVAQLIEHTGRGLVLPSGDQAPQDNSPIVSSDADGLKNIIAIAIDNVSKGTAVEIADKAGVTVDETLNANDYREAVINAVIARFLPENAQPVAAETPETPATPEAESPVVEPDDSEKPAAASTK